MIWLNLEFQVNTGKIKSHLWSHIAEDCNEVSCFFLKNKSEINFPKRLLLICFVWELLELLISLASYLLYRNSHVKIPVFKTPQLKSHLAHFPAHIWKVSASQLAKSLSVCMLPISSKIFPIHGPRLHSDLQRICGDLFVISFSAAVISKVCRTLAADQDAKISEH